VSDSERAIAGELAIEVAHELTEPVRALRDRLALLVDHLERHVATSTGPTPYPWRSLQALRQDLAGAYLEATQLARRVDELDRALYPEVTAGYDLAEAVDSGLRIAAHHLGPGIELLFDLGHAPPVQGSSGTLSLLVAQLVAVCARSARGIPGSTLSVRVTSEPGWGLVSITDNGNGDARVSELGELASSIVSPWGGSLDAASAEGQGCAFELRLPTVST
jgi:signal transduction histidine kinase